MLVFALGILGVTEASEAVRLMSTVHGSEADPHVLSAVQIVSGCGSERRYFSLLRCGLWAPTDNDSTSDVTDRAALGIAKKHRLFIECLRLIHARCSLPVENVYQSPGVLTKLKL